MAVPALKPTLTEFFAWENDQAERHEFYRGEIFAMVGARRVHGLIGGNLFAALKAHLEGSPSRAFVESMKLQVSTDMMFYPDVFVTCDPQDLTDTKRVEVFRRNASRRFELHDQSGAAELHLASVDLHLPMAEVFDGVDEAPPAAA